MRSQLKPLLSFLRPHRRLAIFLVILGFLASLAEGIGIGLFIPLLQNLDPQGPAATEGSVLGNSLASLFSGVSSERRLLAIALAIFGAVLVKALLTFATSFLHTMLSARTGHELRTRIFEEVLTVDFRTLDKVGVGRMLNALSHESWRTADAISLLLQSVITLCTLFVFLTLLLLISWKLTLLVAFLLILIALAVRSLTHSVGSAGTKMTRTNAEVASKMVDGVSGIEVIRGYGQEAHERRCFAGVSERLARLTMRTGILSGAVYPVYEILTAAILVTVLFMSGQSGASLAPLLVFVFLSYRLAPVVKRLEKERVELIEHAAAVEETFFIIHQRDKGYVSSGTEPFDCLRESVALDHVSYQYEPGAAPALRGVSVSIPATGLTAIVGPSGAGKSTMIKLLLRFFDPTEGRILVDGSPLTDLKLDAWRVRMAVVPQKVFLFNATVRENIAYGTLNADDEKVIAAAKAARANDFIAKLPLGYDTRLGEDGVELSGGEGQRICLARAMIRKPEILLLDEATNALDSISEKLIHEAVDTLRPQCAVIVVAHRLATIEAADQILVLNDGRLAEQGDLKQLLAEGGLFAQLYKRQRFE